MKIGRRIAAIAGLIVGVMLLALLLFVGFTLFLNPGQHTAVQDISFSQLLSDVDANRVHDILIRGNEIYITLNDGRKLQTYKPTDLALVRRLYSKGVPITTQP